MQLAAQSASMEERLRANRVSLAVVLSEAGIDRSTWTRWRSGATRPRLDTWMAAQSAVEKVLLTRQSA